ncbi:MAG: GNAT family N-acetyltransferase [Phycisphaerae bacterium]
MTDQQQVTIRTAESNADLRRCFPVVHELRPHLDESSYLAQVSRQANQGYRVAFAEAQGSVVAYAGYRFAEMLAWGKTLYVDDLVTASAHRSDGYGGLLFDWLVDQAKSEGCDEFHLDSGVQRFAAHRFYLRKRMDITSHHFAISLR